jgi:hypothetical protein
MTIKERINDGDASRGGDFIDGKKMLMDTVIGAKGASRMANQRGGPQCGIRLVFSIN